VKKGFSNRGRTSGIAGICNLKDRSWYKKAPGWKNGIVYESWYSNRFTGHCNR